jgi:hypothetical protein
MNKISCKECIVSICCTKICEEIRKQVVKTGICPFCEDKLLKYSITDMSFAHRFIRNDYSCYECKRRFRGIDEKNKS